MWKALRKQGGYITLETGKYRLDHGTLRNDKLEWNILIEGACLLACLHLGIGAHVGFVSWSCRARGRRLILLVRLLFADSLAV